MSAAKMVADSTQSDLATQDTSDGGKKRKKKVKKSSMKKVVLPEDEDSDLDLKKDLKPIGFYVKERAKMVEEMFHSVQGASLQRALPELLKSLPLDELKSLCLEQLEVMSKKRVQRILAGEESANISSSGTDDIDDDDEEEESSDEETRSGAVGGDNNSSGGGVVPKVENEMDACEEQQQDLADSTSINEESAQLQQKNDSDSENNPENKTNQPVPMEEVYIKQEPLGSDAERESCDQNVNDMDVDDRSRSDDDDNDEDSEDTEDEDSVVEEGYEEPPETYTSGSEDGELVRKEVPPPVTGEVAVKQEVLSEEENQNDAEEVAHEEEEGADAEVDVTTKSSEDNIPNVATIEGDLLAAVETGDGGGEDGAGGSGGGGNIVLPSIMMDQMELLELEMRARAIKAMLMTSQQEEETQEEDAAVS